MASGKVSYVVWHLVWEEKTGVKFTYLRKAREICRSVLFERKKIRSAVFEAVNKKLSELFQIDQIDQSKCLLRLLAVDLEKFKKVIRLQQCNYLFQVERLIRLSQLSQLMDKHYQLLQELGIKERYRALFPVVITVDELSDCLPCMPSELITIVHSYLEFSFSLEGESEDEENVYQLILNA